jgi:hypothetical protein
MVASPLKSDGADSWCQREKKRINHPMQVRTRLTKMQVASGK